MVILVSALYCISKIQKVLDGNGHEKVPFEYSYIEPFQNFAYDLVKVNIKKKQLIFRITATK